MTPHLGTVSSSACLYNGYLPSHTGLCDSNSHKLIALYTEHSPLAAESRSTPSIISLGLASSASLSSPFSRPCCVDSTVQPFSGLMCNVEILHRAQIGQNAYTEYVRTIYIYIYRQFSVFTTSVGFAVLAPTRGMQCIVGRA